MPDSPTWLAAGLLGSLGFYPGPAPAATPATPAEALRLEICFQHSCARRSLVSLDQTTHAGLADIFSTALDDPALERAAITQAIALLETYVGARTGTDRDLGGTFPGAFRYGQMDCIDEATNTTRYLQLFAQQGWLHWHIPGEPATRLPIPKRWWPHTTAVIRERTTGREFAVDSWFDANGQPPHIVELSVWRRGWQPDNRQP